MAGAVGAGCGAEAAAPDRAGSLTEDADAGDEGSAADGSTAAGSAGALDRARRRSGQTATAAATSMPARIQSSGWPGARASHRITAVPRSAPSTLHGFLRAPFVSPYGATATRRTRIAPSTISCHDSKPDE